MGEGLGRRQDRGSAINLQRAGSILISVTMGVRLGKGRTDHPSMALPFSEGQREYRRESLVMSTQAVRSETGEEESSQGSVA
jgi:hypothetical protein